MTRRPCPLFWFGLLQVVWGSMLAGPAFGVIDTIDAEVSAAVEEFEGGLLLNRDEAFEDLEESTSELPLIVEANLFAEDDDDRGLAGGVAVTSFNDPTTSGSADPDAFGVTAAAFSPQVDLGYVVTSEAVERRGIRFTSAEIGEADGTDLEARSFFFIDGLLIVWGDVDQINLEGTQAMVQFEVERTSGASDSLLGGSLTLTGQADGSAAVSATGALDVDNVVVIDLSGSVPGLGPVHVVFIPDSAVAYDYDAVVGEPFTLRAAIAGRVENEFHTGAAVIMGVPLDALLELVNDVTGEEVAEAFGEALVSSVTTSAPPLKPLPAEGEATVSVAGASSGGSLFGCGAMGLEGVMLVFGLPAFCVISGMRRR